MLTLKDTRLSTRYIFAFQESLGTRLRGSSYAHPSLVPRPPRNGLGTRLRPPSSMRTVASFPGRRCMMLYYSYKPQILDVFSPSVRRLLEIRKVTTDCSVVERLSLIERLTIIIEPRTALHRKCHASRRPPNVHPYIYPTST